MQIDDLQVQFIDAFHNSVCLARTMAINILLFRFTIRKSDVHCLVTGTDGMQQLLNDRFGSHPQPEDNQSFCRVFVP
ncbi:Anaphase-promoting complex subunit [Trichinella pseudospiralis]